jgi:hypothetical protein
MADRWECLQAAVRAGLAPISVPASAEQHAERTARAIGAPSLAEAHRLSGEVIAGVIERHAGELSEPVFALFRATWLLGAVHAFEAVEREREG